MSSSTKEAKPKEVDPAEAEAEQRAELAKEQEENAELKAKQTEAAEKQAEKVAKMSPIEQLQEATGLSRNELIDRATVATLTASWAPESEALHGGGGQVEVEPK